jgi:hypothetical protein
MTKVKTHFKTNTIMANYYKGDEIKFAINLEAPGFSMDDDDFDIEVKSGNTSVKGYKDSSKSEDTSVVIFKETTTVTPETEEGEEPQEPVTVSTWYAIVDTSSLALATMRVIATAYIVDANANDGVRKNIAVQTLGKLVEA